ncbi:AAA family ATPase [Frondihabitans sucicola]|uniref:AAA family ATPase n=1 Tax=Frondihabitans sucicola TaxID=1268041 RepID=UPI002573726C|nr:AAA family ATPase [Frondihabitans sucicola]
MVTPSPRTEPSSSAEPSSRVLRAPVQLDASQLAVLALGEAESAAVIGAPGSGKTEALIAYVLDRVHREGWGPEAVVALAPTRGTATALRDVLAARLDVPTPGPSRARSPRWPSTSWGTPPGWRPARRLCS